MLHAAYGFRCRGPFMRRQQSSGKVDYGVGMRRSPRVSGSMVGRARFGTSSCIGRAAIRVPTFYPTGSVSLHDPYPDPAYCERNVPRVGPICMAASFSPARGWPLTTRLKPGRVRPDWRSEVLCSGEPGACRHETGLGEPPEGDEQLAGERHDHHPADPSTRSSGTLFKPF